MRRLGANRRGPSALFPLPETVSGTPEAYAEIKATDTIGRIDSGQNPLSVPLGSDSLSLAIRTHEMGHAKWSDQEMLDQWGDDFPRFILDACEDRRVNALLQQKRITGWDKESYAFPVQDMTLLRSLLHTVETSTGATAVRDAMRAIASIGVARNGTAGYSTFTEAISSLPDSVRMHLLSVVKEASQHVTGDPDDRYGTYYASQSIVGNLKGPDDGYEVLESRLDSDSFDEEYDYEGERTIPGSTDPGIDAALGNSGNMRILLADMPAKRNRKAAPSSVPSDTGAIPRNIHRMLSDGKVFTYKRKREGGTVLIDVSGSMHLTDDEIHRIIDLVPAVTIAGYAGEGNSGALVIWALDGRVAREINHPYMMSGNVVDLPALMWLANQTAPRLWVCDGYVTGKGDASFTNVTLNCLDIAKRAHIRRVDGMADVERYFTVDRLLYR